MVALWGVLHPAAMPAGQLQRLMRPCLCSALSVQCRTYWRAHSRAMSSQAGDSSQAQSSAHPALSAPLLSCMSLHCRRFWQAYSRALDTHPIQVKSSTSFVGFLLGDAVAQAITGARTGEAASTIALQLGAICPAIPQCKVQTMAPHDWHTTPAECLRGTPFPR